MSIAEKYSEECLAARFEYVGRSSRSGYSRVKCNVCGSEGEYQQTNIRAGKVRCKECQISKYKSSAKPGWTFDSHFRNDRKSYVNLKHSCCDDLVKVRTSAYLNGKYTCQKCQIAKYQQSAKPGWTFINHFRDGQTYVNIKHNCSDAIVKVDVSAYLRGVYACQKCQITKYQQSAKPGWTFINHFCDGRQTYINLKHSCSDTIVKVAVGDFMNGSYDCPHCMHTHYSDPSYFYVIQVGEIIKLGISNRPDQRYTQYGLPEDSTFIEHIRIPLESKRDALVVESYAKQLVKDFKIQPDIAKLVFTKSGYNECYSIESLDILLTI